uniref:(northern house mosquito) hypothetical protein n=2 Tax=Culex pipiens TaxID=7175 RepID=A0A8D8B8U5_CULPI
MSEESWNSGHQPSGFCSGQHRIAAHVYLLHGCAHRKWRPVIRPTETNLGQIQSRLDRASTHRNWPSGADLCEKQSHVQSRSDWIPNLAQKPEGRLAIERRLGSYQNVSLPATRCRPCPSSWGSSPVVYPTPAQA